MYVPPSVLEAFLAGSFCSFNERVDSISGSRVNGALEPLEATWMTAFAILFAVTESIVRLLRPDLRFCQRSISSVGLFNDLAA